MINPTVDQTARALAYMRRQGITCIGEQGIPALLQAALNPPPEPELIVTEPMKAAGVSAYNRYTYANHQAVTVPLTIGALALAAAYRAMAALDPARKSFPQPTWRARLTAHGRYDDVKIAGHFTDHVHCRKDDP